MLRLSAALLLAVASSIAAAAEWLYTVRPGDEIWNIASRYCGSPAFADRIVEHNQLADARTIQPGSRLRIPIDWLVRQPASAEILNVRGSASLFTPDPTPVEVGGRIAMGHRLVTEDGTVVVGFADGSSLVVAAQSDVLFNILTAFGDSGMVDTNLRFYRGRGTSRVIRRNGASSFRISSPAGTAAVRGTEFRVAVDEGRSLTETLEGEVGFIQDTETSVPAGYGVAASSTGVIQEPLLPAPSWISGSGLYSPGDELSWQPLGDATSYRVSIFLASDLETPLQETIVQPETLRLEDLPPARYVAAVRGISGNDLEGYESTLAVELATRAPQATAAAVTSTDAISLTWQATASGAPYTAEIADDPGFANEIRQVQVDDPAWQPRLPAGYYYWRVKDATSTFSAPSELTVRPETPRQLTAQSQKLDLALSWVAAGADSFELTISRNADFTDPVIRTTVTDPGFQGTMPASGGYHIQVVAIANGVPSEPAATRASLTRPPWWLLGLLAVPFLL